MEVLNENAAHIGIYRISVNSKYVSRVDGVSDCIVRIKAWEMRQDTCIPTVLTDTERTRLPAKEPEYGIVNHKDLSILGYLFALIPTKPIKGIELAISGCRYLSLSGANRKFIYKMIRNYAESLGYAFISMTE